MAGREAADEDGTTHELSGGWNAKTDAIIVWRRSDGRLEVISGRHRLAHARKNGVKHIAVRVYDEDAEHDAAWAKLYDVEVNILANTCNAIDVAYYFRHNPMSLGEAEAHGLMPKTRAGEQTAASRMGIEIAAAASDDTFTALINGVYSAEDVHMACVIASSPEGQALALTERQGVKGKKQSWEYVTALVRGSEQMSGGGAMLDLFGWDTGFKEKAQKMARYVEAARAQLKQRINVLASAGVLQRRADVAKREGVRAERPKDAVERIAKLAALDAAYERMDAGLGIAERADAWDGKSVPVVDEGELDGALGGSFSVTRGEITRVSRDEVPSNREGVKDYLNKLPNKSFRNGKAKITATISGESAKKIANAENGSAVNLMRLGYSEEEAHYIHRAAAVKIGELFEKADLYFEEPVYHKKDSRERAWHFFEPVEVDVNGKDASFLANISVIEYTHGSERLFSLELTIENPVGDREFTAAPQKHGRHSLYPNGASDVRLAAFDSFVKKERAQIERKAREKGLLPWRVDEQAVRELEAEKTKIQKSLDALLHKYKGEEKKLNGFPRDAKKLHDLREALAQKQAEIDAEYKPEGLPDLDAPLAPNGEPSKLSPELWVTVRTQAFKEWFGDWENHPENASKVVDENGEPRVVYHGTVHGGFRVFDVNGRGKTEGSGAFFTSDKRVAQGYGSVFHAGGAEPQVYACFLNIREPYVVDFEGNSWNKVPGRAAGYFVHYDNGESEWFSNKADADFEVSGYEGKAEIEEDWEESPTLDDLAREVWEESPEVDGIIAENVVDAAVGAGKLC